VKQSVAAFCTVLIVDDDELVLEGMREGLLSSFMDVIAVDSGHKALEIMKTRSIDVVVTDQVMPGMSGLQLLKKLRDEYPLVPVLMVTGAADIDEISDALEAGIFDVLDKPYRMDVLISRIQNSLLFPEVLRVLWSVISQEMSVPNVEEFVRRPFAQQMSLLQIYANKLQSRYPGKASKSEGST
jgi:CheY-like chemotaxis protein